MYRIKRGKAETKCQVTLAVSLIYEHHSLHLKGGNLKTQSKHKESGELLYVTWEVNKLRQIKSDLSSCRFLVDSLLLGDCSRDCHCGRDYSNYQLY